MKGSSVGFPFMFRPQLTLSNSEELLIDFRELVGQHSGENMAEVVWATMELYGLIGKVRSL